MLIQLIKYLLVTVICATTLTSCASIMNGSHQEVPISSDPIGADIAVDGYPCGVTPMLVKIKRNRPHVVSLSKVGYQEQIVQLSRAVSNWTIANAFLPGTFIGLGIDASTGSMYKLVPECVNIPLKPRT